MTKALRPDVKQLLNALMREVLLGNTHLSIANGLREADPVVLDTAGVFFGLTLTAHHPRGLSHDELCETPNGSRQGPVE